MRGDPAQILQQKLGRRVAVVGSGKSGLAAYHLLKELGGPGLTLDLYTRHDDILKTVGSVQELVYPYESLIVSPGIPLSLFWSLAQKNSIRLWNEIDVASLFIEDEKIVAITGSAGKSTCTDGLGFVLRSLGASVFVGGNLGRPFCEYPLQRLSNKEKVQYIILELSSYHLENLHYFRTHLSAITSLFPNHLERYRSLEEYYFTKLFLLFLSEQAMYLNRSGGDLQAFVEKVMNQAEWALYFWSTHSSLTIQQSLRSSGFSDRMLFDKLRQLVQWVDDSELSQFGSLSYRLLGQHNKQNLSLIFRLAKGLGFKQEAIGAVLAQYSGLPHRLEYVGEFGKCYWVNDSKATTIASVNQAIVSLKPSLQGSCLYVLLGGRDKNLDWESLARWREDAQLKFLFFGECAAVAKQKSGLVGAEFANLGSALEALRSLVKPKDWVVLSPGGSSLDEFRSFEERGDFFKNWIRSFV